MKQVMAQAGQTSQTSRYSFKVYDFPQSFLNEVYQLQSWKAYFHHALIWFEIAILVEAGRYLFLNSDIFWPAYIPLGLLIAGRQGALIQITHEACHRLISNNRRLNDILGHWFAALPIGITLDGYTSGHLQHHRETNTANDLPTDAEKYSETDFSKFAVYKLLLFDAIGITSIRSFLGHNYKSIDIKNGSDRRAKKFLVKIGSLSIVQLAILALIFRFDPLLYTLLWLIPIVSFNMIILRFRGITEHGAAHQRGMQIKSADEGNMMTRSVLMNPLSPFSWIERILIGSLAINYHHEHHMLPRVPFYNLKKVYLFRGEEIRQRNPDVYVNSYLLTAIFGARKKNDEN